MFLMVKLPVYGNIFRVPASTYIYEYFIFLNWLLPIGYEIRYRLFRLHEMLGRVSFVSWGKCVPVRYGIYLCWHCIGCVKVFAG